MAACLRRPRRAAWARAGRLSSASCAAVCRERTSARSLLEATRTTAAVFTVLIGALLFGYFLTVTQTPQKMTMFLTGLGLGRYGVLALIMLIYLLLGCLMDALAMIILTVPIIFPVILSLGFDPIWFGVLIVMTVELGLIHPPVGMNVFVIKSVVEDVDFLTIFYGVLPFIVTDIVRLTILIAFPIIALYLPSRCEAVPHWTGNATKGEKEWPSLSVSSALFWSRADRSSGARRRRRPDGAEQENRDGAL